MSTYNIPAIASELRSTSEISLAPEVAYLAISTASESSDQQLQLYQIEVRSQGHLVAEHVVAANNALKAITLIENEYGEPVQAEPSMIENGTGHRQRVMNAKNWHGYTFEARVIGS